MDKTREEKNEYARNWWVAHKEEEKERCKKYRETHKEERKEYDRKYHETHKEERKEYDKKRTKKYYESHREEKGEYRKRNKVRYQQHSRKFYLKQRYGITLEKYDELYKKQDGKCAICGNLTTLAIDHDHNTGKIRGLLCNHCNLALGGFRDNCDTMKKAIQYIQNN